MMTSKERMLCAIKNGIPDRVPVTPDISNMIPCKLTGKPFWEIYMNNNPNLYIAYAEAVRYFGIDGWYVSGVRFKHKLQNEVSQEILQRTEERITRRTTIHTPEGDLQETTVFFKDNPPTTTEKMVKDIRKDFPKIKTLFSEIVSHSAPNIEYQKNLCGDSGIFCLDMPYPGMHDWFGYFDGNLEAAIYAYYDNEDIFEEWAALAEREYIKRGEIYLTYKPDVLFLSASGTLTLSSPELVRKFCLPTIKKITRMAKEAGIPTMIHSCGKTNAFIEMLYNETDLNCLNPLEEPPMGDACLKDIKQKYGDKLCLMGNLNTSSVMLHGSVEEVERASRKAIDDGGKNGGFILSTGDQCGRDTPEKNIFKMVEVAKTYGKY